MTLISFGDLAQTHLLRRQTTEVKADIGRLSQELSTGRSTDTARHLSGDMGPLLAIESSLARLDGYGSITRELSLLADAMQIGLSVIANQAVEVGKDLIAASGTAATSHIKTAASAARSALDATMSTLNTRFGDRTLFAGIDTSGMAVGRADVLLGALLTATASAADVNGVEAAVDAWFADPNGYDAVVYLGGAPLAPVPVAPDEFAVLEVTAGDPAIKETLRGLALAALLDGAAFSGQQALRQAVAQRAGERLLASETDRSHLSARLGSTQAQIDRAQTRNEAEATALKIARAGIIAVDPYETATRLQDAETQLQLIYTITARISRMNLADYL